jgi:hypothetical protein
MGDDAVAETVDYVAIRRLQDRYADVVTRNAWPELGDLFLPDAPIEVDLRAGDPMRFTGPTALGEFIAPAIEQFGFFQFVILNSVVDLAPDGDADTATGRMYMSELRTDRDTGAWVTSYGLYRDRYARHDGGWRFAQRRYCSLARTDTAGATEWFAIPQED